MATEQKSAPISPAPQSRLDNCLNSFQVALSSVGDNYSKTFAQEDREKLDTFLGHINNTPGQKSVVNVAALSSILFVFDKVQLINAANQVLPRSLEPLFGAIKYTLAISQKVLGTAWYAGTYLVILAETIKQVDDTMFGEVNVAYVYEIFVKMSCEILDLCVTFVSKASTIKRPVTQSAVEATYKSDLDASLTHLNQQYEAYNSLLGRQTASVTEQGQESDDEIELKKKAKEEAQAKTVQSWLDNIISRRINVTHVSMQEARQKESRTGVWFVNKLKEWLSQKDSNIFWATGIPGAGKSILMSTFIDYLETEEKSLGLTGYAYFYFLYDSASSQKELRIYATLLRQLYRKHAPLREKVNELYDKLDNVRLEPASNRLAEILRDLEAEEGLKIFLAFDALDEIPFDRQTAVMKFIEGLNPKIFYVLVTARDDLTIKAPDRATLFKIQAEPSDIESYIRQSLASSSTLLSYAKSEKSRIKKVNEIVENLLKTASGMFLVTRYQVEHLLECGTVGEMLRTSRNLKEEGVENFHRHTYEQICKQRGEQPEYARRILSWLVFAKRALSEDEIGEAVAIRTSEHRVKAIDRVSKETIIKLCRGLVIYDNSRRVIRLSHKTVQDYLLGELKELQPDIALDCFRYLCFTTPSDQHSDSSSNDESDSDPDSEGGLDSENVKSVDDLGDNDGDDDDADDDDGDDDDGDDDDADDDDDKDDEIPFELNAWYPKQGPLSEYVCSWGMDHLKDLQDDQMPIEVVIEYLTTVPPGNYQKLLQGENTYPRGFTPFHYVTLLGKTKALHRLMDHANASYRTQKMIECQDLGGRTPFMWALRYSDTEMIEAVLGHGANISHTDNSGNQAVFYAAGCTLSLVIRDLIRDSGPIQDATIARAVIEGNVPLVRQFLESGANPSAILKDESTVLHLAVLIYPDTTAGEMVSLLLQWNTNVNAQDFLNPTKPAPNFNLQDYNDDSPIHLAAQSLHKSAFEELGPRSPMKHLTELDVNVFLANNDGDTPLHIAASNQNLEGMSDLLARAGVQQLQNPEYNLNVKNGNGQTILELAFESNHQPMVDLLLQNEGIDVDAQGANGGHTLKWAAIKGMYETAKVIMKRSVTNLNAADCYGYTALHDAAIHNSLEVTESLLQYHADIMLLNSESKTPLLEAAQHGSFEVLERLLREQERLNAMANMDWTTYANKEALLWAAQSGDLKCLELLMKPYGHQLNERNSDEGSTPLHCSIFRRSLPIVKFLLARGADPNLLTTHGKTALDLALDVGEGQIIEALLEHNALSGLPWEMSLLTKKWISESWYPTLQWQLTASERWDLAKCNKAGTTWARITRCMTAPAEVSEEAPDEPYLEIAIPQGGQSPVRRIRFQIRSHDQGWGDEADKFRGSYFNSYSWFEVGIKHKSQTSSSDEPQPRRMIQRNQYAVCEFQEHLVVWDHRDQTPGLNDWLQSLQSGDVLQIYPKARYSGWMNYVEQIKVDIFYEAAPNPSPSPLRSPRIVVYHQTTHLAQEHVSLLPLLGTGVTHVILAAIHVNETPGEIHLNDYPPHTPLFNTLWSEVPKLQASGIRILGMLGGAAGGTYARLDKDATTFESYYLPLKAMIKTYNLQGLDLDVENEMSLEGIIRLIDRLRSDFGRDFLITLAPVATALSSAGGRNLSGFDYFALEKERGHEIAWYNTQFYNGWGTLENENEYNNIICLGWEPSKVVAGVLSHPGNGNKRSYTDMDTLKGTLSILKEQHRDFGGVMGWEYFNSLVGEEDEGEPEEWARIMAGLMNRRAEQDGSDVVRKLALRWREKAHSPGLRQGPGDITKDLGSIVLLQMAKKSLGGPKHFPTSFAGKLKLGRTSNSQGRVI